MIQPGQYIHQESIIHRLDPRVKIIAVIVLSILILRTDLAGLFVISAIILAVSALAHIRLRTLFSSLRPVLVFFLFLFLVYLLFTPGKAIPPFPLGPVKISWSGLMLGAEQIFRFVLLVLAAALMTMTTAASAISSGLERLLRPLAIIGVSSHDIAMMISLALRFFPVLQEQTKQISEAQLARGADFNPRSPAGKLKALRMIAIPLLMNVFQSSEHLIDAMESRGYQPGPRTYLYELSLSKGEYLLIAAMILSLVLV